MDKRFSKDAFLWGFLLWLIGYILGIVLFAVVPPSMLGWVIMPFGILITVWVLLKRIAKGPLKRDILIAVTWTFLAVVLDFIFLVSLFKPADGYYKFDVYVYYGLTFLLPLAIGWYKRTYAK